jgi:hypothetical protein
MLAADGPAPSEGEAANQPADTFGTADVPPSPGLPAYATPQRLAELANKAVRESSGLAASHRQQGVFWTHNDSGDDPRVYAFDLQGRDLGSCLLSNIVAFDCEDMASFVYKNTPYLLLADVGDNDHAATVHSLHVIEEPQAPADRGRREEHVMVARTIHYSYEDGAQNCEAVAIDPTDRTVLLVSKELLAPAGVYSLSWPTGDAEKVLTARRIGTLNIPVVTALDVSCDGRRAVALTYLHAFEYSRAEGESWSVAFSRPPRMIAMPLRAQGESICYGADGKSLYLTSEKLPTPLWVVPPK